MNLIKMGFFSSIISSLKSRKHIPTPIWIQEKGKHLIKIEDKQQEEEETPQETMTTSVKDSMAQKILKALDEHGEALKKMGRRLTRLEISKLKKPSYMEIHDDKEEVEE